MTRPSEPVLWAETADPSDVTEPALKRPAGYQFEDELPHNDFNALVRGNGRWLEYSKRSSLTFPSMVAALDAGVGGALIPSSGDVCEIDLDPATTYPGQVSGAATGEPVVCMDADGLYYYVATRSAGNAFTVDMRRADTDALVRSFTLLGTPDNANPVRSIACDGVHLCVAWGVRFEIFTVADGVRRFGTPALVNSIAVACDTDGAYAYLVTAQTSLGTASVVRYNLATYAFDNTRALAVNITTTQAAVVTTGTCVVVAYLDGSDVALEVFAYDISSQLSTATVGGALALRVNSLKSDGRLVALCGTTQASVFRLRYEAAGVITLVAAATLTNPPTANVGGLDFSRAHILVGSASAAGRVFVYDKHSFELVAQYAQEDGTGLANGTVLCSDGLHVYYNTTNAARRVARAPIEPHGGRWRRCAGSERYRTQHRLLIPT